MALPEFTTTVPLDAASAARVEQHLETCPTCPPLYAALVGVRATMGRLRDPDSVVDPRLARAVNDIVEKTVAGLGRDAVPYAGVLFLGLMVHEGEPQVLEYNVRFGDPETQPVMMRLNSDLVDLIEASFDQGLDKISAEWSSQCSLGIVMAAENYPETPKTGDEM